MDDFLAILGAIALIIATVLVLPFISLFGCAISEDGWLLLPLVNILTDGLNTLFQTTWFTKDMIPLCAGTLGWIGSYFKTSNLGKSKD